MTFLEALEGVETLSQSGNPEIAGVEYDSRRVRPGQVFVAMRGETTDGNRYVEAAIAAGAAAVVTDSAEQKSRPGLGWARVVHGRRALARLSANFLGHPERKMSLTGITGTNGKTTASFVMESMLAAAGRASALVGTVEYHVAGKTLPAPHTTPEPLELNQLLAEAAHSGAREAVMEVSSHALAQERVFGLPFDVAVFTNLTRDHLDYHHDMENYFQAKQRLFEGCGAAPPRVAVINLQDEYGARLLPASQARGSQVLTYGLGRGDFSAERLELGAHGLRFELRTPAGPVSIESPLLGRVNVYNLLAAAAAAQARGCSMEAIAAGAGRLRRVPGRFESVECGQEFTVIVDYAHTDDALRNLTALARESLSGKRGRVITVFGCGGNRDRSKRPLMGEAAGRGSDFVVLTSDNPRSEDPAAILRDALPGLGATGTRHVVEPDRRQAIALAVSEAKAGDIVLIAGKGHEKVQVTSQGPVAFDDVEVARQALRQAGYTANVGAVPASRSKS
ncbi:MAG: UDP-N-acetylmuramoyl-L-alanyl-D-glutamate--2,6-diaminopimelate ligase [Terriglobales bacterium]